MNELKNRHMKTSKAILILIAFTFFQLAIGIAASHFWSN